MHRSVLIVALLFSCIGTAVGQAPLRKLAPGVITEMFSIFSDFSSSIWMAEAGHNDLLVSRW